MTLALLWVLLLQTPSTPSLQTNTIAGIVRTEGGKPAAGIRVVALALPEGPTTAEVLSGVASTDEAGRYRLEGLPQGRYYILAGGLHLPTYYPGTTVRSAGTLVSTGPATRAASFDFIVAEASLTTPPLPRVQELFIPIGVSLEDPEVPVPAGLILRLTKLGDQGFRASGRGEGMTLPPISGEYRVALEGVPPGYALKSLMLGLIDLRTTNLSITEAEIDRAFRITSSGTIGVIPIRAYVARRVERRATS